MNIALISFEYPPDTAFGGIATYVQQAARMLANRQHHVEVFAGSHTRSASMTEDGVLVHRIQVDNPYPFAERAALVVAARHQIVRFDVAEGPEYGADARTVAQLIPDLPLVVKLHTPTYLIQKLNRTRLPLRVYVRNYVGAARRGIKPSWHYDPAADYERHHALQADEIATPCAALGRMMIEKWGLNPERVAHVPYPYTPRPELLAIPAVNDSKVVTFVGRLETRKGILDLAKAIPLVLRIRPDAVFRFVGRPMPSPDKALDMRQYLQKQLAGYERSLEFVGGVTLEQIPSVLADTAICVFPSLWENFPNVCLEAMSAARCVVASSAGGMAEQLNQGEAGRLIEPGNHKQIAEAIVSLLSSPERRAQLGEAARNRVLNEYNTERIGGLQEASYERVMQRRRSAGPRN